MIFLSFFLDLLLPSPVLADDFSSLGDSSQNQFFQTIAYTVESFPISTDTSEGIAYDSLSTIGEDTSQFLSNENILTLTDFGNMRRISTASKISAPPSTKIDILYYYLNNTGHSVNISDILIPFSKSDLLQGNLMNIADIEGKVSEVSTIFNGNTLYKDGIFKKYSGVGEIANGESGSYVIDTMYVKNPLKIEDIQITQEDDELKLRVWIQNESEEYLTNLSFEHMDFGVDFFLAALEEKIIEYFLPYSGEGSVNLGYLKLYNPNISTECAIPGSDYYDWLGINSVTVFANRSDGGWINGAYVQPLQDRFCIQRIAYSMQSEDIIYTKEVPVIEIPELVEDDVIEMEENIYLSTDLPESAVLGISSDNFVLPKTSKFNNLIYLLLVVEGYLWYSFLRRKRIYENNYANSKLCTKSCKNTRERGL